MLRTNVRALTNLGGAIIVASWAIGRLNARRIARVPQEEVEAIGGRLRTSARDRPEQLKKSLKMPIWREANTTSPEAEEENAAEGEASPQAEEEAAAAAVARTRVKLLKHQHKHSSNSSLHREQARQLQRTLQRSTNRHSSSRKRRSRQSAFSP